MVASLTSWWNHSSPTRRNTTSVFRLAALAISFHLDVPVGWTSKITGTKLRTLQSLPVVRNPPSFILKIAFLHDGSIFLKVDSAPRKQRNRLSASIYTLSVSMSLFFLCCDRLFFLGVVLVSDDVQEETIRALVVSAGAQDSAVEILTRFVYDCLLVYLDMDCTLLEMNPFTISKDGVVPVPLDIRVELDGYAHFRNVKKWEGVVFPEPWGREKCDEER